MNKNMFLFIFLMFLFSFLFSCTPNEEEFKNLDLTVVWERDVSSGEETLDAENKILFFYDMGEGGDTPTALNLENGSTIWTSSENGYNVVQPFFDDSSVYTMSIVDGNRIITTINKENGKIESQNKISGRSPRKTGHWTLYNDILYWGGRDRHFVHAYNTQDDADSYKVWGSEDVTADIMGDIVPYNGRLYFVSSVFPYIDEPKSAYLISMLPDGSDVKKLELSDDFLYTNENATQFYDGKLYIQGTYFVCVNPETMQIEWKLERGEKFYSWCGFTISDGKIYVVANEVTSGDSVFCINVKNGKIIWREVLDNSIGTVGYTVQVYRGYVYLPTQSSLIVLNAKSGKYIGRDERLETGALSLGKTISYNDLLIVSAPLINKMYAVRMDMHTR